MGGDRPTRPAGAICLTGKAQAGSVTESRTRDSMSRASQNHPKRRAELSQCSLVHSAGYGPNPRSMVPCEQACFSNMRPKRSPACAPRRFAPRGMAQGRRGETVVSGVVSLNSNSPGPGAEFQSKPQFSSAEQQQHPLKAHQQSRALATQNQ